jgi:hypothetical protein
MVLMAVVMFTTLWVQMPTLCLSSQSSWVIPTKSQSSWSAVSATAPWLAWFTLGEKTHLPPDTVTTTNNDTLSTTQSNRTPATSSSSLATSAHSADSPLYLSLWPWEQDSIGSDRTCQMPAGTPHHCCLGSSGWFPSFEPNVCNLTRSVYERNEAMALSLLPPRWENETAHHGDVECDACRLIDVLWENNWTMAFLGDSVTVQSFVALECELHRRGIYHVTTRTVPFAPRWGRDPSDRSWKDGIRTITELHVSSIHSPPLDESSSPVAVIRLYFIYRPDLTEIQDQITGRHDIVIFDSGLHYKPRAADFPSDMQSLVTHLYGGHHSNDEKGSRNVVDLDSNAVELKLLAWRETPAQHYDTPGGDYYDNPRFGTCAAVEYQVGVGDSRSMAMEHVVQSSNWTERDLVLLPFREWTSHFHEMNFGGDDCTHFCYTPSFWLYEWRQIRIAVERALLRW